MRRTVLLLPLFVLLLVAGANAEQRALSASTGRDLRVATFNVENLYAYRGRSWIAEEQRRAGADKLIDWLPSSRQEYRQKVHELALAVVKSLEAPDIVALQEVENITGLRGDDRVDVLKDLTRELKRVGRQLGQPVNYRFAKVPGQSDERGIGQAFIYRADRVRLAKASVTDPLPGAQTSANPRPLNEASPELQRDEGGPQLFSRPVIAGVFEAYRDGLDRGPSKRLYLLNNHFKSNADKFVERRTRQAMFNAELMSTVLVKEPQANVLVLGDFNLDYLQPAHRKQAAALAKGPCDAGGQARWCSLNPKMGGSTFTFRGKGEQLDWMVASQALNSALRDIRAVSLDSDAQPEKRPSDHNPVVASFSFDAPQPAGAAK